MELHRMTKTLVVYYSVSGHTKQIAEEVAARMGADVDVLSDLNIPNGFFGYLKLADHVIRKIEPRLAPVAHDPADYDLVVLAGPVWSSRMCSPTMAYALQHKDHFKRTALLCTSRSSEPGYADRCMSAMVEATGITPVATLGLGHREIAEDHSQAVADFVAALDATSTH
jgi:flavodoxin